MTIIINPTTISRYPYIYISQDLADDLIASYVVAKGNETAKGWKNHVFKLLECFCHLNNQQIDRDNLATNSVQNLIADFFCVLKGGSLIPTNSTHKALRYEEIKGALINVLQREHGICPEWLQESNWRSINSRSLNLDELDESTLLYWSGWLVKSRKGKQGYLDLTSLYHSHGRAFTLQYYGRWRDLIRKQAVLNGVHVNKFSRFLVNNAEKWPGSTFENPITLTHCFKDFLKVHFLEVHQEGKNLNSQLKAWNRFISNVHEAFIQPGFWPEPFGAGLPRVSSRPTQGAKIRVSKNAEGIEVHNKLITEVPLQYTDDQAIKILFSQIDRDLDTVMRWARNQSLDLRKRQLRRKALAKLGNFEATRIPNTASRSLKEADFPNLCAKFQHFGFFPSDRAKEQRLSRLYGWSLNTMELAHHLGLPTTDSLFPFQCLLVMYNPKITPNFLLELELFNKHGQASGFTRTDAGYQLTGYKDRRKKNLSEQKLILSSRSAALVRQIIEITQPLRDYLKEKGDDNWRKLFLTSGRGFSYPKPAEMTYWKKKDSSYQFDRLDKQFSKYTKLRGVNLKNFVHRITIGSIRASRAVQFYLETKSVHQMAEALGHAKYSPNLLSHYLPDSILAFFQTRWVRLFQKAFICEAMKDSPYLLKATEFESMEELHNFLKNHALKDIPAHLSAPGSPSEPVSDNQVLISIDKGILIALLSVNRAVTHSKRQEQVSGLARYWSNVSGLIEKEIIQGNDSLLKEHLSAAMENLDPQKMESLIYDTAN
ncbi:hypothetical protein [Marinobacter maritimus]|uniref:hypothetical protein n=1 Tax=Marinobacter maritimus TaxID=277961 RepID=UPI0011A66AD0|nr:hypothetical protein [Marinobacter maritimus]